MEVILPNTDAIFEEEMKAGELDFLRDKVYTCGLKLVKIATITFGALMLWHQIFCNVVRFL